MEFHEYLSLFCCSFSFLKKVSILINYTQAPFHNISFFHFDRLEHESVSSGNQANLANHRFSVACEAELEGKDYLAQKYIQNKFVQSEVAQQQRKYLTKTNHQNQNGVVHQNQTSVDDPSSEPGAEVDNKKPTAINADLSKKMVELEEACSNMRNELNGRNSRITELEKQCNALQNEANIKNSKISELEEKSTSLGNHLSEKQTLLTILEIRNSELEKYVNDEQDAKRVVSSSLDSTVQLLQEKDTLLDELRCAKSSLQSRLIGTEQFARDKQVALEAIAVVLQTQSERVSCLL